MTFDKIQQLLRSSMNHRGLQWPSRAGWGCIDLGASGLIIDLEVPTTALCGNFQEDLPASPTFALCTAFWLERATDRRVGVRVRLSGPPPGAGDERLHWHRSLFLLHAMSSLLGDRFVVDPVPDWRWPAAPVLNAAKSPRSADHQHDPLSEHALEVHIANSPALLADFVARVAPITAIHRQLPVGLFDGVVSKATRFTPGGNSQVDLWGTSPDGGTVHLFELKKPGNKKVGIVPEALYYARLLHHLRVGPVGGVAPEHHAVRAAERIVMWLVAPDYHPLVLRDGVSPLGWLNAAMAADGVELRFLPIDVADDGTVRWVPVGP